jgi:hypothetical protein
MGIACGKKGYYASSEKSALHDRIGKMRIGCMVGNKAAALCCSTTFQTFNSAVAEVVLFKEL